MNTASRAEASAISTNELISPRALHSLWVLLRSKKELSEAAFKGIGKEVFTHATGDDLRQLVSVGQKIGLLVNVASERVWRPTPDGESFAQAKHWRLWRPSKVTRAIVPPSLLSTLFIGERAFAERPIVIDLFSGGGGLSLAFDAAGYDVRVAVDNDRQACQAHRENFPDCHVVEDDITVIAKDPARRLCKPYGINPKSVCGVIGGPPCQGFSFMGERVAADERNLLTSRFMDVVMKLEPDFFVMENVAGLLSSGAIPKFSVYVQRLGKSIGDPATTIVDRLPETPTAVAKRDRQFRKRTVSKVITSYVEALSNKFLDISGPVDGAKFLRSVFDDLNKWIEKGLRQSYEHESESVELLDSVSNAVRASTPELAQLALGIAVDSLIKRGTFDESDAENYLKRISSAKITPAPMKKAIRQLVKEYDAAPRSENYRGVTVGPILSHLIRRASKKYEITAPTLLNAAWYGAPQSRQRLFLIGIHKRCKQAFAFPPRAYQLPGSTKTLFDAELPNAPTGFEAIGDLPDVDTFRELVDSDKLSAAHLSASHSDYVSRMRLDVIDPNDLSLPRPSWNPFVIDCSNRTIHTDDVLERLKRTPEGIQEETSHKTRLNRSKVSHTLRAGTREGKGSHTAVRPVHYEHHRVITVREGARLMGYPDWMTFHPTKWHGFRLVGNGVPYQLGLALARTLKAQLARPLKSSSK